MNYLLINKMIELIATNQKTEAGQMFWQFVGNWREELGESLWSKDEVVRLLKERIKVTCRIYFPDVQQKCIEFFSLENINLPEIKLTPEQEESLTPFLNQANELQTKIREIQKTEKEIYQASQQIGELDRLFGDTTETMYDIGGNKTTGFKE